MCRVRREVVVVFMGQAALVAVAAVVALAVFIALPAPAAAMVWMAVAGMVGLVRLMRAWMHCVGL